MLDMEMIDQKLAESLIKCLKRLEAQGWNKGRLAALIGVRVETLRNWRQGRIMNPRFLSVAKLHSLAGLPLDVLLGKPGAAAHDIDEAPAVTEEVRRNYLSLGIIEERANRNWQTEPERMAGAKESVRQQLRETRDIPGHGSKRRA